MTKKSKVLPPQLSLHDRDRGLTCQEALEPCFHACVKAAEASGWNNEEAAYALLHLSMDHLKESREELDVVEIRRGESVAAARRIHQAS